MPPCAPSLATIGDAKQSISTEYMSVLLIKGLENKKVSLSTDLLSTSQY